jgi:hypothetical protein
MKRLATVVLFSAALSASAQTPENQKTAGMRNGRYWAAQTEGAKIDFVIGFSEALPRRDFMHNRIGENISRATRR